MHQFIIKAYYRIGTKQDCLELLTGMIGTFQPERLEPMTGLIGKFDAEYPPGYFLKIIFLLLYL
jgi:hypothetical protein